MPVLALNTLLANMIQLITENLSGTARTDAEVAVRASLSKLIVRLKNPAKYDGQAGCNLYEDVSIQSATQYNISEILHQKFCICNSASEILNLRNSA